MMNDKISLTDREVQILTNAGVDVERFEQAVNALHVQHLRRSAKGNDVKVNARLIGKINKDGKDGRQYKVTKTTKESYEAGKGIVPVPLACYAWLRQQAKVSETHDGRVETPEFPPLYATWLAKMLVKPVEELSSEPLVREEAV